MPLPNDEKLIALSEEILKQFEAAFGSHPGFRPVFDPIPRLDGIEPSDDPLLELRAAVYLISRRRRRIAPEQ